MASWSLALAMAALPASQAAVPPTELARPLEQPKLTKRVAPSYPKDAQAAGLGGVVLVKCTVSAEGRMAKVEALSGPHPLRPAAVKAVSKWRYEPLRIGGTPTPFILTVTVAFKHDGRVTIGGLIDALQNKDDWVRESAAISLGRLGAQAVRALPALMTACNDPSERVRVAAAEALEKVRRGGSGTQGR